MFLSLPAAHSRDTSWVGFYRKRRYSATRLLIAPVSPPPHSVALFVVKAKPPCCMCLGTSAWSPGTGSLAVKRISPTERAKSVVEETGVAPVVYSPTTFACLAVALELKLVLSDQ